MKKKMFAIVMALVVATATAPVTAFAETKTEVISAERTTTTDTGVAKVTSVQGGTETTISVIEGGVVAKTVKYTAFANGDVSYENGATKSEYRVVSGGAATITTSTPVDARTSLTSYVNGTAKSLGGGTTEISVYDEKSGGLLERHTTSPTGIKVVKYSGGAVAETWSMTISLSDVSGLTFGTVTTVVERPISSGGNSSGSNNGSSNNGGSGSNSGNSGSSNSGSGSSSGNSGNSGSDSNSGSSAGSKETSTSNLPTGYVALSKIKKAKKLEKAHYNKDLKALNKLAKDNGWVDRGYKRISSSTKKVVTDVYYAGKRKSDNTYWTFTFRVIRKKSGKVIYQQDGQTVSASGVKGLIKNPEKYF